jgi:hypothetical protein
VSDTRPPAPSRAPSRGRWIAITLILLPAIVVPLWVPLYDKVDPRLNGWPFFFWFQMALILFATTLTAIAYTLSRVADREDRDARRGDRS